MGRTDKGLTTFLDIRNKSPNNKQKARFAIIDITKQYFRKLLNSFDNSPYLGYNIKHVPN